MLIVALISTVVLIVWMLLNGVVLTGFCIGMTNVSA